MGEKSVWKAKWGRAADLPLPSPLSRRSRRFSRRREKTEVEPGEVYACRVKFRELYIVLHGGMVEYLPEQVLSAACRRRPSRVYDRSGTLGLASGESLPVDTVIEALAVPGSISEIDEALIDISAARGYERSMGVFGVLGDDIDHGVDGICSPDGAAWAPDDFDPFDILEQCVLDLPINAGEERSVNAPSIDKHQYRSG